MIFSVAMSTPVSTCFTLITMLLLHVAISFERNVIAIGFFAPTGRQIYCKIHRVKLKLKILYLSAAFSCFVVCMIVSEEENVKSKYVFDNATKNTWLF